MEYLLYKARQFCRCPHHSMPRLADHHPHLEARVSLVGVFVPSLSSCTTCPCTGPKYQPKSPKTAKMVPSKIALRVFLSQKGYVVGVSSASIGARFAGSETRAESLPDSYIQLPRSSLFTPSTTALGPSSDWRNVALADAGLADAHSSDPFDTVVKLTFWNRG